MTGLERAKQESPNYEAMSDAELAQFGDQIRLVAMHPRAGLVGGAAVRVWMGKLGLPIVKPIGGDVDIVIKGGDRPEAGTHHARFGETSSTLDVFTTQKPLAEPYFVDTDYCDSGIRVASLPCLLVERLWQNQWRKENGASAPKDEFYARLLTSMVSPQETADYFRTYVGDIPAHFELEPGFTAAHLALEQSIKALEAA